MWERDGTGAFWPRLELVFLSYLYNNNYFHRPNGTDMWPPLVLMQTLREHRVDLRSSAMIRKWAG